MPLDLDDTIVALASAPGAALRGIVRLSGPGTADVVACRFRADTESHDWQSTKLPRRFSGHLELPSICAPVPAALMYWPGRRSYTGQPSAEIHLIGSPPLLDAALTHFCESGARLARRGEFTMRAFLSGRMDLLQAEAVLGVIEATDHEELHTALSQLGGGITARLAVVRSDLISLLADLEAGLDFVDEDIEFVTSQEIVLRLNAAVNRLRELESDASGRLPSGTLPRVVLAGLPNAGKSTLFNRLIGHQKAIVSSIAGTTRDYLTAPLELQGRRVELIDTAGWEDATDLIMERAQALRAEQIDASDVVIWCTAADLPREDLAEDARLQMLAESRCPGMIRVTTRSDLAVTSKVPHDSQLSISALTGANINSLRASLLKVLSSTSARSELLGTTAVRCRESVQRALQSLRNAATAAAEHQGDELIALEIRQSLHELGVILGDVYTDDILDQIFSRFCIGK